jgi:chromosome segregation ATPase
MARVAQGTSLPSLGGGAGGPMGAPHPPRAGAGSRSARTPRSASQAKGGGLAQQAMAGGDDADAMFATHLRRMAPEVLARELKTIMDEVTLVKLEKKSEVERLERHLHEAELEVAEARRIKAETRQFRLDQEALLEEKEAEIRSNQAEIKGLERDKKKMQRGLADMAKLSEEEKALLSKEREAFETEIRKTLKKAHDENERLCTTIAELEKAHSDVGDEKKRVVDSARVAKLGLLKELKEAKVTLDQTEQERQDEVARMTGLSEKVELLGAQLLQFLEENQELKRRSADAEDAVTRMARQMEMERDERAELQKELDRHLNLEAKRRQESAEWQTVADKAARLDELEPILSQTEGQLKESRKSNDQIGRAHV